jgi:hypothetical protein
MKRPREVIQPRWGVYALRRKAERVGTVEAVGCVARRNAKPALLIDGHLRLLRSYVAPSQWGRHG